MWESFVFLVINLTLVTSWIVYFSVATILYLIIYLFLRNNGVIIRIHIFNQIIKFQGYRCKSGITIFERSWSLEITLTVLWKFRHLNKFRWMFLFFSNGTEPLYPWFREPSNQGEEWKKSFIASIHSFICFVYNMISSGSGKHYWPCSVDDLLRFNYIQAEGPGVARAKKLKFWKKIKKIGRNFLKFFSL